MDLFEAIKDITRAYCEQKGLPSPDGRIASEESHTRLAEASDYLDMIAATEE